MELDSYSLRQQQLVVSLQLLEGVLPTEDSESGPELARGSARGAHLVSHVETALAGRAESRCSDRFGTP